VIFENDNCQKRKNNNFIHGKLKRKRKKYQNQNETKTRNYQKAIKSENEKNWNQYNNEKLHDKRRVFKSDLKMHVNLMK